MTNWDEFENTLNTEFLFILSEYRRLVDILSEDARKDFVGLLRYTAKDRKSFLNILKEEFSGAITSETDGESDTTNISADTTLTLTTEQVKTLLNDPLIDTFSHSYTLFPLILQNWQLVPIYSLVSLCEKYWKTRYPSIKQSFIIPMAVHIFTQKEQHAGSLLKSMLMNRLLKGKLIPFDQSVALAKLFSLPPADIDYYDRGLSALKEILINHGQSRQELLCVLKQSGCHCDWIKKQFIF